MKSKVWNARSRQPWWSTIALALVCLPLMVLWAQGASKSNSRVIENKGRWSFDAKAGAREIAYRRVGRNELDAIALCRGYVEAQYEYALEPRNGYEVHQYAQRIISSPGKHDGLAWQNAGGLWDGP